MSDILRFICAANDYNPTKIGQHFLEVLLKVCQPEERADFRFFDVSFFMYFCIDHSLFQFL